MNLICIIKYIYLDYVNQNIKSGTFIVIRMWLQSILAYTCQEALLKALYWPFDVLNYHREREREVSYLIPFCVYIKKNYNKIIEIFIDIKSLNHIKACNSIQFSAGIYHVWIYKLTQGVYCEKLCISFKYIWIHLN